MHRILSIVRKNVLSGPDFSCYDLRKDYCLSLDFDSVKFDAFLVRKATLGVTTEHYSVNRGKYAIISSLGRLLCTISTVSRCCWIACRVH